MHDLEAIVEAHCDAVWRTAYRLLNHREDALDCYQEAFLTAARLIHKTDVKDWRALLVTIATRRAMDRLRARYRARQLTADATRTLTSGVRAPDARLQDQELREQVREALAALPAQQAEAFWLRHMEQLSVAETSDAMHCQPGHVRVLVHRALAALRQSLAASHEVSLPEESP